MYQDFKELLSLFNEHEVKYLVVGGYAVSFHAQPMATEDLDILIKADAVNAAALYAALVKFGAPLEGLKPEDLADIAALQRADRSRKEPKSKSLKTGKAKKNTPKP